MAVPSNSDPQFKLRIPARLKSGIEAGAAANNRTVTAEILYRLECSAIEGGCSKSLRDEIAIAALIGLAQVPQLDNHPAILAYEMADAMLAAREGI